MRKKAVSGDALPPHLDADNISLTGRYSVGGKPHLTAFDENIIPQNAKNEVKEQAVKANKAQTTAKETTQEPKATTATKSQEPKANLSEPKTQATKEADIKADKKAEREKEQARIKAYVEGLERDAINKIEALNNFTKAKAETIPLKSIRLQAEQELKEFAKSIGTSEEKLNNFKIKSLDDLKVQLDGLAAYVVKTKDKKAEAILNKYIKILDDIFDARFNQRAVKKQNETQKDDLIKGVVDSLKGLQIVGLRNLSNFLTKYGKTDEFMTKANSKWKSEFDKARALMERDQNITPIKDFGTNYAEFYHDGENAIKKLLTEKQGQVAGAFERKELGDIDLVWGEVTDAINHKGYGLSHILDKRVAEFMEQGLSKEQAEAKAKELINKLPDIIKNGGMEQKGGRFRIQKDNYVIGLTSEYKGEKRNWIITAFEKGNPQSFTEADFIAKSDNLLTNPNKNSTPKELLSQGKMPVGWKKGATNIGSSIEQPKWANKFKTKMEKMGQEYNDEKIANLAKWHKDSHAVTKESDGSPKVFYHGSNDDKPFDYFMLNEVDFERPSAYFSSSKKVADTYRIYPEDKLYQVYLNIKNPLIIDAKGLKYNSREFQEILSNYQNDSRNKYDGVIFKNIRDDYANGAGELADTIMVFNPNQIKSIDNKGTFNPRSKMMNGFSTMAMQKAILNLGSGAIGGAMNANAEQDPNKKAEAFVKGFLLGAGGSAGAIKMLEKSADKLAPQLAQTSQRLAKDLPMILNDRPDIVGKALGKTPKENYNYIFGGQNAIGANKAKLKTARDMAKNGADESEIWAKTGWYKDIDKKWKFEINPKGGELDISALKKATPNKLGHILKDDELFKAYPQVKDLSILPTQTKDGANAIYHETEAFGSRQKAIFFDYDYLQNATNDEIRSTLYHEIQHAIQSIEGFAPGGSTQKLSYEEYKNLAGESEARNVEKRLNKIYSKDDAIDGEFNRLLIKDIDNPKWQELKQKWRELILAGKRDEADKIKKQLDQRQEFLKREAVKNVERFSSYSPHPFNTLDINP
ncbi:putative barnase/colicin E5 family endoribonuclease, partial [Campylobacter hyointestinalis]|uniref:putative barnase/colicin E5 family endoribonuclease n=3 Tax=Campylobacter hyointestinalis TaxID=198 RepID=UPI000DCD7001